jgi:hypothetical protein
VTLSKPQHFSESDEERFAAYVSLERLIAAPKTIQGQTTQQQNLGLAGKGIAPTNDSTFGHLPGIAYTFLEEIERIFDC